MKRSADRFLTTHTGSLPRPEDLVRTMFAREEGVPVDAAALAARIGAAVAEVVRKQADAGLDVVDDGELSKPSYATYVKDRLAGFGGTSQPLQYRDLVDFPELAKRVFGDPGPLPPQDARLQRADRVRDARGRRRSTPTISRRRSRRPRAREAFMTRGLAGGHLALLPERALPEPRGLPLRASPTRCGTSTRRSRGAGFVLQVDCPDLAMGRHIQFADLGLEEFRRMAAPPRRGAQPRARRRPARAAAHARLLGQLRGAAPLRRPARRHHRHRLRGAAQRRLLRGRQPAARPRVAALRARAGCPRARS